MIDKFYQNEITLVYLYWSLIITEKHCCTQANGDSEDNAPPDPEDKNRLKVKKTKNKIKQPTNLLQIETQKLFLVPQTHSGHVPAYCFIPNWPLCCHLSEKASTQLCNTCLLVSSCRDLSRLFPQLKPSLQRGGSSASLHNSTMRNTIFQLMIHTLDPLGEGEYHITTTIAPMVQTCLPFKLHHGVWKARPSHSKMD